MLSSSKTLIQASPQAFENSDYKWIIFLEQNSICIVQQVSTIYFDMQGVKKKNNGGYTCRAQNSQGEATSNEINLSIKCK